MWEDERFVSWRGLRRAVGGPQSRERANEDGVRGAGGIGIRRLNPSPKRGQSAVIVKGSVLHGWRHQLVLILGRSTFVRGDVGRVPRYRRLRLREIATVFPIEFACYGARRNPSWDRLAESPPSSPGGRCDWAGGWCNGRDKCAKRVCAADDGQDGGPSGQRSGIGATDGD